MRKEAVNADAAATAAFVVVMVIRLFAAVRWRLERSPSI